MGELAGLLGAAGLAVCQWLIYSYAPVEASLGIIQKIFYLHLPLAWWALISFFLVFAASIGYLLKRKPIWDHIARASAETGVLFCGLALLTGIIWGKVAWGVWWTWDPRLTTTLIMWFIYAGYLILRNSDLPHERKQVICAGIGIVGFLDVPLVFFSARIFRSIHPAVFTGKGSGMETEMLLALIACIISLGLFWAGMTLFRIKQLELANQLRLIKRRLFL